MQFSRSDLGFFCCLVVLIGVVYGKIFHGLYFDWANDENYSHGFLVPAISGYFLWQSRDDLAQRPLKPANSGLLIVILALLVLCGGVSAQVNFALRISFVLLLCGMVVYLLGWSWFVGLLLPLGFLLFMIPLPYIVYDSLAFPLKLFVAKVSVWVLKLMGVVVLREGNIIMFPETVLEVADACSGLRSLMSLLALGVALAFFTQKRPIARVVLVLLTVPIAIVTNMIRVIGTGFLAQYYGAAAAEGFFHEFAGMGVFLLAMVLLFLCGGILRKVWP